MNLSVDQILDRNLEAFDHMLGYAGMNYDKLMLGVHDGIFDLALDTLLSEDFTPKAVLDGGGTPYSDDYAKQVLIATALDIPMTVVDGVPVKKRREFFGRMRTELVRKRSTADWYTLPMYALRMRPLIEGSRKSLEGYWLEKTFRLSLTRVAERLGLKIDPKNDRSRYSRNRTVITLRSSDTSRGHSGIIRVQVKGVNNNRHHMERAKILAKFAEDVRKDGDVPMPILVGDSQEIYPDIPALKYVREHPGRVINKGEMLDHELLGMVCSVL
jgi:hypothetical protein